MTKTYTSTKGVEINLRPISQRKLTLIGQSKAEIPVPTYRVKTVGGDEQEFPLDAVSAENKGRSDEWNEYIAKVKAEDAKYTERFTNFVIWEGVDVVVPGPDSDWEKTNEFFGIKAPTEPISRKTFYVYNEILGTAEEIGDLIVEIMTISKLVKEEDVDKLRDSFRFGVQRKTDSQVPAPEGTVAGTQPDMEPVGSGPLLERQAV